MSSLWGCLGFMRRTTTSTVQKAGSKPKLPVMQNLAEVQDLGQRVDDRLRVLKERFDERLHALQARVTGASAF